MKAEARLMSKFGERFTFAHMESVDHSGMSTPAEDHELAFGPDDRRLIVQNGVGPETFTMDPKMIRGPFFKVRYPRDFSVRKMPSDI
jgi:hypothetical protein